jgi:tetratricopeptide (TPR) repeat protein
LFICFSSGAELGPIDGEAREIGDRAAFLLGSAGQRAFGRNDMHAAANLLGRARELLDVADPSRAEIAPELAEALMEEGEFGSAATVLSEAARAAADQGDVRQLARIACVQVGLVLYAGDSIPRGEGDGTLATDGQRVEAIERAIEVFERAADFAGLARAYRVLMIVHGTSGRYVAATEAADRCVHAAALAGDTRLAARGASGFATGALHGPSPVDEVIGRCEELLDESSDRKTEAVVSGALGVLHAMRGDFDRGRELADHSRSVLLDLGRSVTAASTSTEGAVVALLAEDLDAAEHWLRRDDEALESMGERYFRSTIVGLLGLVLVRRADAAAALEQSLLCEMLADDDDVWSQALWRAVRGRAVGLAGEVDEAVGLAAAAVGIADASADLDLRAGMRAELGDVLALAGRDDEAAATMLEAVELYARKGNVVMAERLSGRAAGLTAVAG